MIITCKCLNVAINLGTSLPRGISLSSLQLTDQERSHSFFAEGVAQISNVLEISKQIPSLFSSQAVGDWTIDSCINCSIPYFAKHIDATRLPLISAGMISDPNTIYSLKNHLDYSPVFRIVIKPYIEDPRPLLGEFTAQKVNSAISGLQKQLGDVIHKQTIKTEENIRNFSDQQYELLGKFRDRASSDHTALVRILRAVEATNVCTPPSAPAVTTPTKEAAPASLVNLVGSTPKVKHHAASSAIGITSHRVAGRSMSLFSSRGGVAESFDADGIFSLEGMENSPPETGLSEGESDTDHDDSGSHDEGIDLRRKKGNQMHLARSLPVNVPVFAPGGAPTMQTVEFDQEKKEPEDPQDIAASIKALARSVHGEALFGDLPRPRFSSQI